MKSRHKRFKMAVLPVLSVFLTTTIVGSFPAVGLAQQPPPDNRVRVYVFPMAKAPDVSRIISVKIEEFFSAILGVNDKIHVLREEDLIIRQEATATGPKVNAGLDQADKLVWQGKEELESKHFKEAVQTFRSAVELYQQNFAELVDYDKLVDAYLSLAVAYFGAGYEDNGTDALGEVVSLRPTVTVDRKQHSQSFVEALARVQKKYGNYKPGTVTLNSTPPGAKVYVDGVLRGTSPTTVKDLQKGHHYVQMRLDGYEVYPEKIRAPLGKDTLKVDAKLKAGSPAAAEMAGVEGEFISPEPLVQYAESGNFGLNFKRAAQRFTQKANVHFLLYQYLSTSDGDYLLNLFIYDREKNEIAALQPIKFDRELTNLQVNLLEAEQVLVRGMAVFPSKGIVSDPPPAVYREGQAKAVAAQTTVPDRVGSNTGPVLAPIQNNNAPRVNQPSNVKSILGDYPLAADGSTPGVTGGPSTTDDEQWYEKWWVWTLIGVGVAGAGVGSAAAAGAFSSSSPVGPPTFTGTVTVP